MVDWPSLLLGGIVGSLTASVLAYFGARRLQDQAIKRHERGVARAVYYEIATIASDLTIALKNGLAMPEVATDTYDRGAGDIAQFLTPVAFDVVALAYYSIHVFQWHSPVGEPVEPDLAEIIGQFAKARLVLEAAAFTTAESVARRNPS